MDRHSFVRWNNGLSWGVFGLSLFVYALTAERSVSIWDCGEFISTGYKLQVSHPPGTPLHTLLSRIFVMMFPTTHVAYGMSLFSGISSAFAVFFLFRTITIIARIIWEKDRPLDRNGVVVILGCGLVGALSLTFSDTFWVNATEAEVYGLSTFFMAAAFWCIMKWYAAPNEPFSVRWWLLAALITGLSLGVHNMNMALIVPAVFVFLLKKYPFTLKNLCLASVAAVVLFGITQFVIVQGLFRAAIPFEWLMVNYMGWPFNSGFISYVLLLMGVLSVGIWYTQRTQRALAHHILLAVAFIAIGYSSFALVLIRSSARVPVQFNAPDNVFNLLSYIKSEMYGAFAERPFLSGKYFDSPLDNKTPFKDAGPYYYVDRDSGKYVKYSVPNAKPNYAKEFNVIFSRMYSNETLDKLGYRYWIDYRGSPQVYQTIHGDKRTFYKPTFNDNLRFFLNYQLGWLNLRYLMWNFVGRQNDIRGTGNLLEGNWLSGISFFDNRRLTDQRLLPAHFGNNKGKNHFYFLPLLLGLFGALGLLLNHKPEFTIIGILFLAFGVAITIFINQLPIHILIREREYILTGSFYAFAIFIGLGVMAVYRMVEKRIRSAYWHWVVPAICLLTVPGIMAKEGWDDHDRSRNTAMRDISRAFLDSCAPNAILFTFSDNDTFPLWYLQEVEGYRTDVRIINYELLTAQWYIDQLQRAANSAPPVKIDLEPRAYRAGINERIEIQDKNTSDKYYDLDKVLTLVLDNPGNPDAGANNSRVLPTNRLRTPVDSVALVENGLIDPDTYLGVLPEMKWTLNKPVLSKSDLMLLQIIRENKWRRPIYFSMSAKSKDLLGLNDYLRLEGLAYQLLPTKEPIYGELIGTVNASKMYDLVMHKFQFHNINDPDVYINFETRAIAYLIRHSYARLADYLLFLGEKEKALNVLDRCVELLPDHKFSYDKNMVPVFICYYELGEREKAQQIARKFKDRLITELQFYAGMNKETIYRHKDNALILLDMYAKSITALKKVSQHVDPEFLKAYENAYIDVSTRLTLLQ